MKQMTLRTAMSVFVSLCLLLGLLALWPAVLVRAAATVPHDIGSDGPLSITDANANTHYTVSGTSTTNTITINASGEVPLTLSGVDIRVTDGTVLNIESGQVTLLLVGDNTLKTSSSAAAALRVDSGASLTIQEASTGGSLYAWASHASANGAGIGGGDGETPGPITIESGSVTAKSGGAGIGGGGSGSGGKITIKGGTVTATGTWGAGIGSGDGAPGASAGEIAIKGGTVTATSNYSPGIGGGYSSFNAIGGDGGRITISGASTLVTAISTWDNLRAAAIGGAGSSDKGTNTGGTLFLSGGATLVLEKTGTNSSYWFYQSEPSIDAASRLYQCLAGKAPALVSGTAPKAALALTGGSATASALFDVAPNFGIAPAAAPLAHGANLDIPPAATKMTLTLSPAAHNTVLSASATGAEANLAGNVVTVTPSAGTYLASGFTVNVTLREDTPGDPGPTDPGNPGGPATPATPETPTAGQEAIQPSSLSLNMGAKLLKAGQKVALKATVSPANAEDKTVVWASSNKKVATVTSSGLVKALKNGKATITAKAGGKTVKCQIIVRADAPQRAVKAVKLHKRATTLKLGKTLALKATPRPERPFNKKLVWASSDPSIATVNAKGVVKAKAKGRVKITATSFEGGKVATCTVTVN